jgi:hypothetical protein
LVIEAIAEDRVQRHWDALVSIEVTDGLVKHEMPSPCDGEDGPWKPSCFSFGTQHGNDAGEAFG